jgi:arylsulfatase
VSLTYSFDSAQAAGRRRVHYFEMFINRGIYQDGWWAASRANVPWEGAAAESSPDTMKWELYNLDQDFSQATDLAAREPQRLRQLQDQWWAEAAKYNVLPLDGRKTVRLSAELQGRPSPTAGRTSFTYYPDVVALPAGSAPNLLNKSWSVTADVEIPAGTVNGAVFSMGALDGGFGLYVRDGRPVFAGNFLGRATTRVTGSARLPRGKVKLRAEFTYDGGGMGKGGLLALFVNDRKVGEARMAATHPLTLGLGGALDIGEDSGAPVDEAYTPPFRFNGTINSVTVELRPAAR